MLIFDKFFLKYEGEVKLTPSSQIYSFLKEDHKGDKKAKGINKDSVKK